MSAEVFIAAVVVYALGWAYIRREDRRRRAGKQRSLSMNGKEVAVSKQSIRASERWTDYYVKPDRP